MNTPAMRTGRTRQGIEGEAIWRRDRLAPASGLRVPVSSGSRGEHVIHPPASGNGRVKGGSIEILDGVVDLRVAAFVVEGEAANDRRNRCDTPF